MRAVCVQVYHNYGFDRHVLYNHGINAVGFGGDTMHMARLWSASRAKGGFSLESLTDELLQRRCARSGGRWLSESAQYWLTGLVTVKWRGQEDSDEGAIFTAQAEEGMHVTKRARCHEHAIAMLASRLAVVWYLLDRSCSVSSPLPFPLLTPCAGRITWQRALPPPCGRNPAFPRVPGRVD